MEATKQYIDFYHEVRDVITARSCREMNDCREAALQTFSSKGFPSQKVERYRYAKVEADFSPNYGIALTPLGGQLPPYCFRLVEAEPRVRVLYNNVADTADSIVALNTMLCVDTLVVHVPQGIKVEHPIQISNILKGEQDTMVCRRILVVMDELAEADIIITDRAASQSRFLTNQVVEVVMGNGSHLNLYDIEETHLLCTRYNSVFVRQGRDSSLHHTCLTLFNGHCFTGCQVVADGKDCQSGSFVFGSQQITGNGVHNAGRGIDADQGAGGIDAGHLRGNLVAADGVHILAVTHLVVDKPEHQSEDNGDKEQIRKMEASRAADAAINQGRIEFLEAADRLRIRNDQ